jgi:histone deacetylase 1/2
MPFAPSVQAQEVPGDFNVDDYIEGEDSEAEEADIRRTRKFI